MVEQGIDVDVLARQATTQDVVGVGHDLNTGATEVGVHGAGSQVNLLTRCQSHPVHEQGDEDGRVTGMVLGQLDGGARQAPNSLVSALLKIRARGCHDSFHDGHDLLVTREHRRDDLGQSVVLAQRREHLIQSVELPQSRQQNQGGGRVTETTQSVEIRESDDHLGLRPVVTEDASGITQAHSRLVLSGESPLGLLTRRVGLDTQGMGGRQDLE